MNTAVIISLLAALLSAHSTTAWAGTPPGQTTSTQPASFIMVERRRPLVRQERVNGPSPASVRYTSPESGARQLPKKLEQRRPLVRRERVGGPSPSSVKYTGPGSTSTSTSASQAPKKAAKPAKKPKALGTGTSTKSQYGWLTGPSPKKSTGGTTGGKPSPARPQAAAPKTPRPAAPQAAPKAFVKPRALAKAPDGGQAGTGAKKAPKQRAPMLKALRRPKAAPAASASAAGHPRSAQPSPAAAELGQVDRAAVNRFIQQHTPRRQAKGAAA